VPPEQYVAKHRAAPAPTPPANLAGPRHLGTRARPARKALRSTVTVSGLAAAATGVAVAAGMVHTPSAAVNLADSLSPSSNTPPPSTTDLDQRSALVSRSFDRRDGRDPAKAAALGLTQGPAVGGQESLSAQDPQGIAAALLPSYGWSASQMSCLVPLWMGESGWRVSAENVSSGAYGIPQALPGSKMGTAGADWRTNAATQIKWGLGYIQERYGSPCGAWGFKQGHGWY
jgi:hypothetical protein